MFVFLLQKICLEGWEFVIGDFKFRVVISAAKTKDLT
jgi:hypothetical protein